MGESFQAKCKMRRDKVFLKLRVNFGDFRNPRVTDLRMAVE